jgi:hypothetical protein
MRFDRLKNLDFDAVNLVNREGDLVLHLLVGGAITILKNMSLSMGRIIPYIATYMKWKIKFMFETTNQYNFCRNLQCASVLYNVFGF